MSNIVSLETLSNQDKAEFLNKYEQLLVDTKEYIENYFNIAIEKSFSNKLIYNHNKSYDSRFVRVICGKIISTHMLVLDIKGIIELVLPVDTVLELFDATLIEANEQGWDITLLNVDKTKAREITFTIDVAVTV